MARGKKKEVRRPVKARGSLPAPKVAPVRVRVPIHRRRGIQVLGGLILLIIVFLSVRAVLDARRETKAKEDRAGAVERFGRTLKLVQDPIDQAVNEMVAAPDQVKSGEMPATVLQSKTESWLKVLRDFTKSLKDRTAPAGLEEARALYVSGAMVYIDAVKAYQVAAAIASNPQVRDQSLTHGRNLIAHAGSVFALAKRDLEAEKRRLGVGDPNEQQLHLDQPIQLPEEEVPPAGPGQPGQPDQPPGAPSP